MYDFLLQVAAYLQELVTGSGLNLNLGLVQTAYANGSSTNFLTQKMVSCVRFLGMLDIITTKTFCNVYYFLQISMQ